MVELLDLSDVSLTSTDSFDNDFRTSTPRRCVTEPSFRERSNMSVTSIRPTGPPPPVPKRPKPQTAVTKSTFEDIEVCLTEKSLRKISSAKELLECWYREMNETQKPNSTRAMPLRRRHSEIFRRRFTSSLEAGHRPLEIAPEDDLPDALQCSRIHTNTGLSYSEQSQKSFTRNCPTRKARRSRVTASRSVILETTSGSNVSRTPSGQYPSGFRKMSRCGNRDLEIHNVVGKKCECSISFVVFV